MVNVPQNYVSLLQGMSKSTGIPYNVEAAQASVESGFNPTAISPSNAQGWLQFLPSTYNAYAAQAGVAPGTEFNPSDEAKVYDVFMRTLLHDEGGNLRNALAAYNAGEGNLSAGLGYADTILGLAGQGNTTIPSTGTTPATTTSALGPFPGGSADPLNWIWGLFGGAQHAATQGINELIQSLFGAVAGAVKKSWADAWKRFEPDFIRIGLILLGVIIIYAGIQGFLRPASAGPAQITIQAAKAAPGTVRKVRGTTP